MSLPVPSCLLGPDRRILSTNDEFRILCRAESEVLKNTPLISEFLEFDTENQTEDLIEAALARTTPLKRRGVIVEIRDVGVIRADISTLPRLSSRNTVENMVLIIAAPARQRQSGNVASLAEAQRLLDVSRAHFVSSGPSESGADEEKELLIEVHRHLQKAYADMSEELEMAKSIQEGLMPDKLPETINLKSSALYMPAGKVGGDLYDVIITPHQKVAVLIFDVSGHGVPAALIAAMAKMLFMHYIDQTESPAEVFTEVNRRMCRFVKSDHYLTAFLGIISPVENTMVYSKAGHVPPLVYHSRDGSVTSLKSRGFFIGHSALEGIAEYFDERLVLDPGDKLLFYTDGLTEGANPESELYGSTRLVESLQKHGNKNITSILREILHDQTEFRQGCPLRDDFTILCIETGSPDEFLKESGFNREEKPSIRIVLSHRDIEEVAATILREMDHCGFADKNIKRTKVCIYEMLTNAIEHGNDNHPEKKVIVVFKVTPEKAMVSVVDEGPGFDFTNMPNPLAPENIMKDHGRGLFIIHRYMDEVHFNESGSRILAVKYHDQGK